jgi:hypothetical protein
MEISNHEGGKSFILKGADTKKYKDEIKKLGGKWNSSLVGWVFPNRLRENVEEFLKNPVQVSEPEDRLASIEATIANLERELNKCKATLAELKRPSLLV